MTQTPPTSPAAADALTLAAVTAVESRIRPYVRWTPVISIDRAEFGLPAGPLTLKLEMLQHSGSFKVRGAFANLLLRDVPAAGVTAASGGNHGAAVAYAAGILGVPARIFVPEVSSPAKISRIREYGADLVIDGATYSDAFAVSQLWVAESGALRVHAFNRPRPCSAPERWGWSSAARRRRSPRCWRPSAAAACCPASRPPATARSRWWAWNRKVPHR